ncbi:MAG TPA: hypothetical protein VIF38_02995 [Burkholderiales bacterium]|jgi:hypothetical protein
MTEPLLTRLAKAVIFILFVAAGIAGFFLGNPVQKERANQDEVCRVKCADLQKLHRLVPVTPGKPDGPAACECY